jgi:outer membrane protein assembly factor BamB
MPPPKQAFIVPRRIDWRDRGGWDMPTDFRGRIGSAARTILLAWLLGAAGASRAQAPDLSGWWQARIERQGEHALLYLHLDRANGRNRARLSIPMVRTYEAGIGTWQIEGDTLRFTNIGWTMQIGADRRSLTGTFPDAVLPGRFPAHFERAAPVSAPPSLTPAGPAPAPIWRVSVGAEIWAGLTADPRAGLLFVAGDDGTVTALSTAAGRTAWSATLDAPIRATPTLAGGRLYVATDRSLFALDPARGTTIWRAGIGEPLVHRLPLNDPNSNWANYASAAVVRGGLVVLGSNDGCVYAFGVAAGARRWRTCVGQLVTGTPAIAGNLVFFGAFDGRAYALSLTTGAERWRHDTHGPIPRDAVVVGRDVLFGSRSYDLVALDRASGRPAWTRYFWFSWVDSPPVLDNGTLYVGSSDSLAVRALAPATGRVLWQTAVPGWTWPRVAPGANAVYAAIVGSDVNFAPRAGALAALDRRNGTMLWMFRGDHAAAHNQYHGFAAAPTLAGGRLFAADLEGRVYAFVDGLAPASRPNRRSRHPRERQARPS